MTRGPGRGPWLTAALMSGYTLLYVPISILIVYSFNESRLVSVWGGFSPKWYAALLENEKILTAAWLSVKIAAISATAAVALGLCAAIVLARFGCFRGRTAFSGLLTAPLIMPEVIVGLAILLLFVWLETAIGWPAGRGAATITLAHVTVSVAYTTLVIRARLVRLDASLEAAAADLGAPPWRVFAEIVLPLLAPALAAAWLLAFTLSFDDLVVASFVSGPGSSTLPMVVFSSVRLGVTPEINALATLLVLGVAMIVGGAGWLMAARAADARQDREPADRT